MTKEKKQLIVLMALYIFHKSCVKTLLKWFINNCFKGTY